MPKLEYFDGVGWYTAASESFVDAKIFNINSNTSGQLNISRLNGYPANSSVYLRGDGTWATPAGSGTVTSVGISVGSGLTVTGSPITSAGTIAIGISSIAIPQIAGYAAAPTDTFIRGNNTWSKIFSSIINFDTDLNSGGKNINAQTGTLIGNNISAHNSGSINCLSPLANLNLGSNLNLNNFRINNGLSSIFFSNGILQISGGINTSAINIDNLTASSLPYININTPISNLTLYNDLTLNGNKITDSNGLHRMSFVGGTLEVSSSITTGRYYSYGWLNSSGGTGAASGTNYYSIVCQDRIAASEFNATSSKKIKKIIPNLDIEDLKQKFLNLNFHKYNYIDSSDGKGEHYGVIAEDLSLIFPQFVDMEKERHIPNCVDEQGKMESIYFNGKEKNVYKFNHKINLNNIDKNSKFVRLFINNIFYKASIINITPKKLYIYFENNDKITIDEYLKNNKVIYIYGTYEKCPTVEKNKLFEIGLILLQELLKKTN